MTNWLWGILEEPILYKQVCELAQQGRGGWTQKQEWWVVKKKKNPERMFEALHLSWPVLIKLTLPCNQCPQGTAA